MEQYLSGNLPLHPERLVLPSEEELDAAEKEFDRFVAKQKQPARLIAFWPIVAAVAAVLVAVFLLRSTKSAVIPEEEMEQNETIVQVEQTEPPKQEEVTEPVKIAAHTHHKTHKTQKIDEICESETNEEVAEMASIPEETLQEEEVEVSPIPADKQALADMFLAEEALQVAYELQAQQEAIRAYAASLIGVELPKPIIAF
ncbi:MAG: hypothetical protein J5733_04450 [Bacteroidaceae bacterium]|nr:hypothetical protein [Bacteroidaceae bacterium]